MRFALPPTHQNWAKTAFFNPDTGHGEKF